MVRLIASDIDGTLLPEGETAVDPAVFEEIRRLRRSGVLFCPASGRQYTSMRRLFAPVADSICYLSENGAVVFGEGDPSPVLAKTPIDRETAMAVCNDILARPDCEVLISGADTSYMCPKREDIVAIIRDVNRNNVVLVDRPEDVPEDVVKIAAYCRRGAAAEGPSFTARWSAWGSAAVAGSLWVDFNQTDKGEGLLRLCAALGIPPEDVMAFGDNFNDLAMLKASGHPCIMDNAAPELRAMFPRHCARVLDVLRTLP